MRCIKLLTFISFHIVGIIFILDSIVKILNIMYETPIRTINPFQTKSMDF